MWLAGGVAVVGDGKEGSALRMMVVPRVGVDVDADLPCKR
jgi:hypothetical protein